MSLIPQHLRSSAGMKQIIMLHLHELLRVKKKIFPNIQRKCFFLRLNMNS